MVSDFDLGPGLDGVALLGEVRDRVVGSTRFLVTGSPVSEECFGVGVVHGFFAKPWRAGELTAALLQRVGTLSGRQEPQERQDRERAQDGLFAIGGLGR